MAVWCVCVDLQSGSSAAVAHETRAVMAGAGLSLPAVLQSLGRAVRVCDSTYLLSSDHTADEVMEQLWPLVLDERERVVVVPVDVRAEWRIHSGAAGDPVVAWLGDACGEPAAAR